MRRMISISVVMLSACAVGPEQDPPPAPDPLRAIGLGGEALDPREELAPGAARARIKPFSALAGEYVRVLGVEPAGLAEAAGSFGAEPLRYFREPVLESGSLRTAHDLALAGCGELVASFEATSDADGCAGLARRLWSREMSEAEAAACVELAASIEPDNNLERWTRVCASVMSTAGFLTY